MKRLTALLSAAILLISPALALAEEGQDHLYSLAAPYGFKMGAPLSYGQMTDRNYLDLVAAHFNSVTTTNEMKAYSLLDQRGSRASEDGMPVMDYRKADTMVAWARKNGIGVRGHVLVWDAYMLDWFFHEGYDSSKPYADQETIRSRTERSLYSISE